MNELVVNKNEDGLRIGILHDKVIVELQYEKLSEEFSVGDLLLGRVKKIVPGLNAAFVDVGHPRDAFLHYFDLGPQIQSMQKYMRIAKNAKQDTKKQLINIKPLPDINKHGKMADVLQPGQEILVQVVKEPISTKGPRLSSEISIPGQYVVLVPFSRVTSVSKKIRSSEERRRLKVLAESLKPPNFGMIIRTAAEGKDAASLSNDISGILERWDVMTEIMANGKPPTKVLSEHTRATSILRDMMSQGFDTIYTDDKRAFQDLNNYLSSNQPDKLKTLKFYKGKIPLFQHLGLERQIKASFGKIVSMAAGAYLVIEHTEAMHVIDVNSGSKNLSNNNLEDTALKVNTMAAEEIARQLRLRDMGGIIVIDFIDMKKSENRRKLNDHLRKVMKDDRARHSILPISRFGLVQITRQRVRPQLKINTAETCPSCNGSGKIQASILIADEIQNNVDFIMKMNKEKRLKIVLNPFIASYFTKGWLTSYQWKWFFKYRKWVTIRSDTSLPFAQIKYYNTDGSEIKL